MFSKEQVLAALRQLQPADFSQLFAQALPLTEQPIEEIPQVYAAPAPVTGGGSVTLNSVPVAPVSSSSPTVPTNDLAPVIVTKVQAEEQHARIDGVRYVWLDQPVNNEDDQRNQQNTLDEFLQSAGLEEYGHTLRNDHGIDDLEMFVQMEKEDINLFCHIISHRIQFRKLLADLKGKSDTTNPMPNRYVDSIHEKFNSLRDFLENRPEGRSIMSHYNLHNDLTNSLRNELVRLILLEGLNMKITLDSKFDATMTSKIIELFPEEKQTPSEVRRKINERIQYLKKNYGKVSLQPQIVMVGSAKESPAFFIVFGGAEYKADNVLHAICLCLQVSFMLNLEYAVDCKPVWMFIQTYLFGIYASVLEIPKVTKELIRSISG